MDQKVCDVYDRIIFIFTDGNVDYAAVFFCDHAVDREWKSYPLIFLDTAIVVGIEVCKVCVFIQRILFYVETWGVDVCAEDVHTFFQRFLAYVEQCHDLFHSDCIYFISRLDLLACCLFCFKADISVGFCFSDKFRHTFTLCLACIKECAVILCKFLHLFLIRFSIRKPCVFSFHNI